MNLLFICTIITSLLLPVIASAASGPQGARIYRVDDGVGNRCIGSSDKITTTLRQIVLDKNSQWLGMIEDKSIGITLTTHLIGKLAGETKTSSFAKVLKVPVEQYNIGRIMLAQEQSMLSQFKLSNNDSVFTTVNLEIGIVRERGESTGAKILMSAVGATSALSLPSNPFASTFSAATTYVNSVFKPLLDQAVSSKEAVTYNINMNINAGGCTGDDEKTGTKAIIVAVDDPSQPGYIDISNLNKYCIKSELNPSFVIKFAPGSCEIATNFTEVQNPYLAFYVNAIPQDKPLQLKPNAKKAVVDNFSYPDKALVYNFRSNGYDRHTATEISKTLMSKKPSSAIAAHLNTTPLTVDAYRESIMRCKAIGIPMDHCF